MKKRLRKTTYKPAEAAFNAAVLWSGHILGKLCRKYYIAAGPRGQRISERTLKGILRRSRNTELGRKYGFSDIKTPLEYQKAVPLSTYEDYKPYIRRMIDNGEQGLITGEKVLFFATTTGTISEKKLMPQVLRSYMPYFKALIMTADDMYEAMRRRGLNRRYGKSFITTEMGEENVGGSMKSGMISRFSANGIKPFIPALVNQPGAIIGSSEIRDNRYVRAMYALKDRYLTCLGSVYMTGLTDIVAFIIEKQDMLIHDIETGTVDPSVDISDRVRSIIERDISPDPERAAELREIFADLEGGNLLSRIWKDLSVVAAIGVEDFKPFSDTMRSMCDDGVSFCNLQYASSECFFGNVMGLEDESVLLFPDAGFFEFIPVEEESDRPLFMHELEEGKLYEIILTSKAGLYRYQIRDVVRVTGFEGQIPYLEFAYRADKITNMCSVHLTGAQLAAAVNDLEKHIGIHIADHCIYADAGHNKPRIELFMEMSAADDTGLAEDCGVYSEVFDAALRKYGWDYAYFRENGVVDKAVIYRVGQGTFRKYRDMQIAGGTSPNQLKALRVIDTQDVHEYFSSHIIASDQ